MSTTRITGAVLLDVPVPNPVPGGPVTTRATGAVLIDVPDPAALLAKLDALTAAVDRLTAAQATSGALIS